MEELLKNKLKAAKELVNFTKEIMEISLITDYDRVHSMIDERQQYIEKINIINEKMNEFSKIDENLVESSKVKNLKQEIRETFKEIAELDNSIRKNINNELISVKKSLNQPEALLGQINIKA